MLGRKLIASFLSGALVGDQDVTRLTLVDVIQPPEISHSDIAIDRVTLDLSVAGSATTLVQKRPDLIYHLAAIVSGEAEQDIDKGYRINLDGTRHLFESIRAAHEADGYCPRVIFTSSIAVFGAPFPERITDTYYRTPQTSYGTQKAICELLLEDHTRHGFFDGMALRMPTVCIRPGKPNKAASGFFSSILREPLAGQEAVLPVPDTVRHWHASPRAATALLRHAATLDGAVLGQSRSMTMPGLSATVAEQIEALRDVAGNDAVNLISAVPDETIMRIVKNWPRDFDPARALSLGFKAETSFHEIIKVHLEDELQASQN